jgi:hypothetical protein
MGTGLNNRIPPHRPRLLFPAARSSGSRPVTSRTPPAPPRRPGCARSLTCPAARHGHGSYQGTGDASHARPAQRQNPAKPPLTRPRSFREDTNRNPGRHRRQLQDAGRGQRFPHLRGQEGLGHRRPSGDRDVRRYVAGGDRVGYGRHHPGCHRRRLPCLRVCGGRRLCDRRRPGCRPDRPGRELIDVAADGVALATDLQTLSTARVNAVIFGPRSCAINQVHQCFRRRHQIRIPVGP